MASRRSVRSIQYQALKMYENKLIENLEEVDVVSLAEQAVKKGLVLKKVRANLKSVDPSVPRPVQFRYLLYSVYQHKVVNLAAGEVNSKPYAEWLQLLSKWNRKATACFRLLVNLWSNMDRPLSKADSVLAKNYVLFLTEALAGCCSRWKEIAVALGLHSSEIRKIQAQRYTAILCLKDVFAIWVNRSLRFGLLIKHTESLCYYDECCNEECCNEETTDEFMPLTLQNMNNFVCIQVVGIEAEVYQLMGMLLKPYNETETNEFEIISQSSLPPISEGNIALFEVQVSHSPQNSVALEWSRSGSHVVNSYGGISVAILCLHVKDLTFEGVVSCVVTKQTERIDSRPIQLTVTTAIDEHINVLHDRYKKQPEVPEDVWPGISYTDLALNFGEAEIQKHDQCTAPPKRREESPPRRCGRMDESPPWRCGKMDESPPRRRGRMDETPPWRHGRMDGSPPWRCGRMDESPPWRHGRMDGSPPWRHGRMDESPPWRRGRMAETPPWRHGRMGESPPWRRGRMDGSPPWRHGRMGESPPWRRGRMDRSPPWRYGRMDESPPRRRGRMDETPPWRHGRMGESPPWRHGRMDGSPPWRHGTMDGSPPRRRSRMDESPPRRRGRMDETPPWRHSRMDESPSWRCGRMDETPPWRHGRMDGSPPWRHGTMDGSPPWRCGRMDESPPRRRSRMDESPPRRCDESPPRRRGRMDETPPWRHGRMEESPPRCGRMEESLPRRCGRMEESCGRLEDSPPRRRGQAGNSPRRQGHDESPYGGIDDLHTKPGQEHTDSSLSVSQEERSGGRKTSPPSSPHRRAIHAGSPSTKLPRRSRQADDTPIRKDRIMYNRAFNNLKSGTRLLVKGQPGSGKTTLVHKISRDWVRSDLELCHCKLLLLIHLQDFCSCPNIALCDLLEAYYDNETAGAIAEYAVKHSGVGLCFILDGLDEYVLDKRYAFITKLIKKKVLPEAIVILACRPVVAARFRSIATMQVVEVCGFLKDHVADYISKFPFSDGTKNARLFDYLEEHPNIYAMCCLPIHAAMVCYLFNDSESGLPLTETEIHSMVTRCMILHNQHQALKEYEGVLIEGLREVSLVYLAEEAAKKCLVSGSVVNELKCVHTKVPHAMKCRYLLYKVYTHFSDSNIDPNSKVKSYEKLLEMLSKGEKTAMVLLQVSLTVLSKWRRLPGVLLHVSCVAAKAPGYGTMLMTEEEVESHISNLTEILGWSSSKWHEIATAFGLSDNEIKKVTMHGGSPVVCLREVLFIWAKHGFPDLTSEYLLWARADGIVDETSGQQARKEDPSSRLETISKSADLCVPEGNCALFEVQVSHPLQCDPITCRWMRQVSWFSHYNYVCDTNMQNGTSVCILCVAAEGIWAEGVYTCFVGDLEFKFELTVITPIDGHGHELRYFYSALPEVPKDTWPPAEMRGDAYVSLSIDSDYVSAERVIYDTDFGARVVIEGRQGSGKTTFVHKLSLDWAKRELKISNNKHRLLFLIRDEALCSESLIDVLKFYYTSASAIQHITKYAEEHGGLGLCFILDGLDENASNFLTKLVIGKEVLPNAVVITTFRPGATQYVLQALYMHVITRHIQVVDFSDTQLDAYIEAFPFSDVSKHKRLQLYLLGHPDVHHMCRLPLHAAMMCILFEDSESDLPQAETKIHEKFTKYSSFRMKYQALKEYEDELIDSLTGVDLVSLAGKAVDRELVAVSVRNDLELVHSSVSFQTKCRYLFYSVYQHSFMKTCEELNSRSCEKWLKVLSSEKVTASVLLQMNHWFTENSPHDPANIIWQDDTVLSENHIGDLTEALAGCSSNWREIATSLGLSDDQIKNIYAVVTVQGYSPVLCLKEVLTLWIKSNFPGSRSPTINNLKNSLRSQIVRLGKKAYHLLEALSAQGRNKTDRKKRVCELAPTELRILNQSPDLCVSEGRSVLLEVQVGHPISYQTLCFKWCDDRDQVVNKKPHSVVSNHNCGTSTAILCMRVDDLTFEGVYNCRVLGQRRLETYICLRVTTAVDEYVTTLRDFYTEQPQLPEDTWPPPDVSGKTYINLALIKQDHAGAYVRKTIGGNVWDDIFMKKDHITYERVFSVLHSGARLLIEGRPGSGKTTLVHKVSKDWANGDLRFYHNRLLLLIHLRAFCSDPDISLRDLLECYYDSNASSVILEYACNHSGLGLCFILDGLDEYTVPNTTKAYIFKLIRKQVLPKAKVIVVSRPAAAANFRSIATMQVEVIGFLKEQVYCYIEDFPFCDSKGNHSCKCVALHQYLEEHPNVHHMCYLPIHAAMICFLFNHLDLKSDLPQTETEIYKEFTRYMILRVLCRSGDFYLPTIEHLPEPQKSHYFTICKLAYETTLSSKQVMKHSEVQSYFNVHHEINTFGLVTVDKMAERCGFQKMYTFLHLTFQEYLGACFISSLGEERQLEVIAEHGGKVHMQQLWKFFCGLATFEHNQKFEVLIKSIDRDSLYRIQCCYESQQAHLCDTVVENNSLLFPKAHLSPSNFLEIAYVISNTEKNPLTMLSFDGCTFEKEGIDVLLENVGEGLAQLITLCYHNCDIEGLKIVKFLLHSLPMLKVLDITGTNLGEEEITALTEGLNHSHLEILVVGSTDNSLYFSLALQKKLIEDCKARCKSFKNICFSRIGMNQYVSSWQNVFPFYFECDFPDLNRVCNLSVSKANEIKNDEAKAVAKSANSYSLLLYCDDLAPCDAMIQCHGDVNFHILYVSCRTVATEQLDGQDIQQLHLHPSGISVDALAPLCKSLVRCCNLLVLNLSFNVIKEKAAEVLGEVLCHCSKLHKLDVSSCVLGSVGAKAISKGLNRCIKLIELRIKDNNILNEGAKALTMALKPCVHLHVLEIASNGIEGEGFDAIADGMKCWINLASLDVSCNVLSFGIKTFCGSLAECCKLQVLDLSFNAVKRDDAVVLGGALQCCYELRELRISSCSIEGDDMKVISEGLKTCKHLREFTIDHNDITGAGAVVLGEALKHFPELVKLDISSCSLKVGNIEYIAEGLKHCINLLELKINYNDLRQSGALDLSSVLKHCTKLNELDVRACLLGTEGVLDVAKGLRHCINLRKLNIRDNNMLSDGAKALAEALKKCASLEELDISSNGIDYEGAEAIVASMEPWIHVHSLNLSSNKVGIKSLCRSIVQCCQVQCCNLKVLDISSCFMKEGAVVLGDALKCCSNIHKLDASSCSLGCDDVTAICEGLKVCTNLLVLKLNHNNICSRGSSSLAEALKHCIVLQELEVNSNRIGYEGFRALADSMKSWNDISSLDASCNQSVITTLCGSLSRCYNLKILNLSCNVMDRATAVLLGDALKCTKIHRLDVSSCFTESDAIKGISEGLTKCVNLVQLNISSNKLFFNKGVKALTKAMKHCSSLQELDVNSNDIDYDGFKALSNCMESWTNLYSLDVSNNRSRITPLLKSLKQCVNLQILNLSSNVINGESATVALRDALLCSSKMRKLDISSCSLQSGGVTTVSGGLRNCVHLMQLKISTNNMLSSGAKALANALNWCTSLRELEVGSNGIESAGFKALAASMKHWTNICSLDVSHNSIGVGIEPFSMSLMLCSNLRNLNLSYNIIGRNGAVILVDALRYCDKLQKLDVRCCSEGVDNISRRCKLMEIQCPWEVLGAGLGLPLLR